MIKTNKTFYFLLFVSFLFSFKINAKEKDELRLRMGVEMEMKIMDRLKLEIIPEIRLQSKNEVEELYIETGLSYELTRFIKVGGLYRAYWDESEGINHRFAFDLKPFYKKKDFEVQYRLRYTNYTDFDLRTEDTSNYIRNRIKIKYEIDKLKIAPYVSTELFYRSEPGEFQKLRYMGGLKMKLNKKCDFSAYYILQKKINKSGSSNILGFTFNIEID